jgi:hypothetical protein
MTDFNDDAKGVFRRVEVLTGPCLRRCWADEQKMQVVAEAEVPRVWSNDRVREAALPLGLPLLDLNRIWGNGGTPNTYLAEYDSGDYIHLNYVGIGVAATALAGLVRTLLQVPRN